MDAIRSATADLRSVTGRLAGADVAELSDGELTEHIAELHRAENQLRAAQVQAAGQLEGRPVVAEEGFKGAAGYLAHHQRLRYGQVARTVSLAKKRWVAPETIAALEAGQISEAQAQLIAGAHSRKVAAVFARDEALLVEKAQQLGWQDFYWFIRSWVLMADPERGKAAAERAVKERRAYCAQVGDRVHTSAVSDPISGATIKEALDRVEQELFVAA